MSQVPTAAEAINRAKGTDFIGVSCVLFCYDGQGRFVMHQRGQQARDEQGRWEIAGESLEFGESFEAAVRRGVKEEYTADLLTEPRFLGGFNVLRENKGRPTHWVALVFAVQVDPAQVAIGEPHKIDDIGWFTVDRLPQPRHSHNPQVLELAKQAGLI